MALRYVDDIQVLTAGNPVRTINCRPLRMLPDNSIGVTFDGRVHRLQHRRIELTAGAWRKADTKLLLAGVPHAGIEAAINPRVPPAVTVEVGDRVWFVRLSNGKLDQVLIVAGCEIPLVRIASPHSPVGESLLGQSQGKVVTITTPRETYDVLIFDIEKLAAWEAA